MSGTDTTTGFNGNGSGGAALSGLVTGRVVALQAAPGDDCLNQELLDRIARLLVVEIPSESLQGVNYQLNFDGSGFVTTAQLESAIQSQISEVTGSIENVRCRGGEVCFTSDGTQQVSLPPGWDPRLILVPTTQTPGVTWSYSVSSPGDSDTGPILDIAVDGIPDPGQFCLEWSAIQC